MELVPDHVQRALAYLHLLKKRGIDPRRNQVEDFARTQPPRGSRQETPWAALALLTGLTVARDAEPVVDYLVAMGWAEIVSPGENVRLTGFGEAFLVGVELEDAAAPADPAVADVVLEPKDPLVYVHLTRYLAQAGAGLLVDPYFKAKFVPWLAETTIASAKAAFRCFLLHCSMTSIAGTFTPARMKSFATAF